jgi:hypothetical protein
MGMVVPPWMLGGEVALPAKRRGCLGRAVLRGHQMLWAGVGERGVADRGSKGDGWSCTVNGKDSVLLLEARG